MDNANPRTFPPLAELVPHGEAMVLLDAMQSWAPGQTTCSLTLRPDAPFVVDGTVDTTVSIEYMAQAVAACLGYEALQGGHGVRVGVIIGCRRFNIHAPTLSIGREMQVSAKRVRGTDSLSHFSCAVEHDGETLADAVLTLYHAERPPKEGSEG